MKNIKIAYIGGGSKQWARVFMNDLALCSDLTGEIGLFDIDKEAAVRNHHIGKGSFMWCGFCCNINSSGNF